MKTYDYLIFTGYAVSGDCAEYTELMMACKTLEKALNVVGAYYGAYYGVSKVVQGIRRSGYGRGPWIRDMRRGGKDRWTYDKFYAIQKVERH